jgi:hypothetical protein
MWVSERALLARLFYAQIGVPPAEVAPLARGDRRHRERFSTRAAEAAAVEVGDGGQGAAGFCVCCCVCCCAF